MDGVATFRYLAGPTSRSCTNASAFSFTAAFGTAAVIATPHQAQTGSFGKRRWLSIRRETGVPRETYELEVTASSLCGNAS